MRLLHDSSNRLPGIGPAMTWKSILCQCEELPWGCLTLLPLKGIATLQSHIFQQAQSHLLELRTPSATRKTHIFIHIDCRSIRVNIPNYNNFSCREQKNLKIWKKINKKRPQVVLKDKPESTFDIQSSDATRDSHKKYDSWIRVYTIIQMVPYGANLRLNKF